MRSEKIVATIFIRGLQNFDKYETINPLEIKIDGNKI